MNNGQATLEFVFATIAVLFLMFGMVMVFRWVGMDMAQRRWVADQSLNQAIASNDMDKLDQQLYRPSRINAFANTTGLFK